MTFLEPDKYQGVKGAAHGGVFLLAAACAGYNLAAFCKRRQFHLFVNTVLYGALVGYEIATVRQHWSRED